MWQKAHFGYSFQSDYLKLTLTTTKYMAFDLRSSQVPLPKTKLIFTNYLIDIKVQLVICHHFAAFLTKINTMDRNLTLITTHFQDSEQVRSAQLSPSTFSLSVVK